MNCNVYEMTIIKGIKYKMCHIKECFYNLKKHYEALLLRKMK